MLEQMAHALLSSLNWHGLAMVEFKYNPTTKQAWFIEINPRLWGSVHLAISAGVEFPYLHYLCATKGAVAARSYHATRTIAYPWKSRWYLGDCILAASHIHQGKILQALRDIKPGNTNTYDDINISDPGAFVGEILYYGYGFLKNRSVNPINDGMLG